MDGDELAVADQFADRDVQVRERRVKGADALEYVLRVSRDGVHGLRAVHDGRQKMPVVRIAATKTPS